MVLIFLLHVLVHMQNVHLATRLDGFAPLIPNSYGNVRFHTPSIQHTFASPKLLPSHMHTHAHVHSTSMYVSTSVDTGYI